MALILIHLDAISQAINPIIHADVPDWSIIRVDDTYYMSSTTMHMSPGVPIMKSKDLVNWELVSYAYDELADIDATNLEDGENMYGRGSWASCMRYVDGTYYVSTFSATAGKTFIFSTDDPENGEWKRRSFEPSLHDNSIFFDDDGQAYLFWGNLSCRWVKLKDNLLELDGPINYIKPKNFIEGPWVYKRKNLYYLVYASKGTQPEMTEYYTSSSIQGPWDYRGIITDNASNSFTIHPGIIDYKGKSYFFYHNGSLPTGGSYRRSICVDYMYYNQDGSIKKIKQTKKGVKRIK